MDLAYEFDQQQGGAPSEDEVYRDGTHYSDCYQRVISKIVACPIVNCFPVEQSSEVPSALSNGNFADAKVWSAVKNLPSGT